MKKIFSAIILAVFIASQTLPRPVYAQEQTFTIEENDAGMVYTGTWTNLSGFGEHGGLFKYSGAAGDSWEYTFEGTSVSLYAFKDPSHGICDIYLDDVLVTSFDAYGPTTAQYNYYNETFGTQGTHTVKMVVTGTKNASSTNYYCTVDYLTYTGTPQQETTPPVTVVNDAVTLAIFNQFTNEQFVDHDYTITGQDTPVTTITGYITSYCRNDIFCPTTDMSWQVINDTGSTRTLNVCYAAYFDELMYKPAAAHAKWKVNGVAEGPRAPMPYVDCVSLPNVTNNAVYSMAISNSENDFVAQTNFANYKIWYVVTMSWGDVYTCDKVYQEGVSDTLEIDPTIETPLGPAGAPADNQIYDTVLGNVYTVSLDGGPWNDGANARNDAVVSWDGVTWFLLSSASSLCVKKSATSGTTYYLTAESDTFYIRANDTAGNFADNTSVTPWNYTITEQIELAAPCESQYTYDEFTDVMGFTGVNATNSAGVLANNNDEPLVVGEWYTVRWNYGAWKDNGTGPERIDLEYSYDQSTWNDLGLGGDGVWCATADGKEVLFQATAENVYLRVNDPSGNAGGFLTNTGNPFYDLYHATFIRTPTSCETKYQVGDLLDHGVVDAFNSTGTVFMTLNTRPDSSVWALPAGVEYGGWYVLDTTDGPWRESTLLGGDPPWRFDISISEDDGATWTPLASWTYPVCNFEIDAVGHRRVIFQAPFTGSVRWKFRVNDTGVFLGNQGSVEWDLYGAAALATDPQNGQCDYSYDTGSPVVLGEIDANDADGVNLTGLTEGELYAVRVIGTGYGWAEALAGTTQYDAEITDNGGTSWSDLPNDYAGALCGQTDGNDTTIYIRAGQNYSYALRVNSTTFDNNTGSLGYAVYPATPGQSVVNTCFDGWSLQEINSFDWLDVKAEQGEVLSADTARYQEFIALVPGRTYAVETPAGQGPWGSLDAVGTERYDVALSKDNGVTWEEVNTDSTIIDCSSRELIGNVWKARFTVTEGDVWKIRVNDDPGAFANNSGNMAYKFYVLCEGMACTGSVPNDGTGTNGIPGISIQGGGDVCQLAVLRPGPLSAAEIFDLGNYLASWVQYMNLSVLRYMAWCPVHTSMIATFLDGFKTREPLATADELRQLLEYTKNKIDSYDWGGFDDTSLFSIRGAGDVKRLIDNYILKRDASTINPWNGQTLLQFGNTSLPASYYSCSSVFADGLPARLKSAVCFVSAYFKQTGAAFWVQLLIIDIPAVGIILAGTKNAIEGIISLMIGIDITKRDKETEKWLREQTRLMEEQNALLGRRRK